MRRLLRRLRLGLILVFVVLGAGAPRLFPVAHVHAQTRAALARPSLAAAPPPSGAAPAFPFNNTLAASTLPAGAPPQNDTFSAPAGPVGSPPQNDNLTAPAQPAPNPIPNGNFATGSFADWTTAGSPSIQHDPSEG